MVTFNVKDFARITTEWAAAGKSHAGCLLIVGIDHAEFGLILRVIDHALSTRAEQAAWIDYTAWGIQSARHEGTGVRDRPASVRKGVADPVDGNRTGSTSAQTPSTAGNPAQTRPPSAPVDEIWTEQRRHERQLQKPINGSEQPKRRALCRTRTDDPFLTMEGSGFHERSRTLTSGHEMPVNR